jgi:hypothetical protein
MDGDLWVSHNYTSHHCRSEKFAVVRRVEYKNIYEIREFCDFVFNIIEMFVIRLDSILPVDIVASRRENLYRMFLDVGRMLFISTAEIQIMKGGDDSFVVYEIDSGDSMFPCVRSDKFLACRLYREAYRTEEAWNRIKCSNEGMRICVKEVAYIGFERDEHGNLVYKFTRSEYR